MIEQFSQTEKGADDTFKNFPNQAQEIIYNLFTKVNSENELIARLDSHIGLKEIFGVQPSGYMKQVDAIMRFYRFFTATESKAA